MDAEPEAHAEGGVEDAAEHKTLDRAAHLIPIVHYHYVQYDCDDRPNNSVDDFKSFHIHVVLVVFLYPYQAGAFLLTLSCALSFSRASFNFSVESFNFSVESFTFFRKRFNFFRKSCFVGRSGNSPDLEWLGVLTLRACWSYYVEPCSLCFIRLVLYPLVQFYRAFLPVRTPIRHGIGVL